MNIYDVYSSQVGGINAIWCCYTRYVQLPLKHFHQKGVNVMQTFRFSLIVIVFSCMSVGTVLSQWVRTNGPFTGHVYALASKTDGTLFTATQTGCSRTTDNGNNWVLINNGLAGGAMYSLAISPTGNIFGGSFQAGIFRSINNGSNWSRVYASLVVVWGFAINSSGTIFAGTDFQGVVRSTDGGTNWTQVGLTGKDVLSLAVNPSGIVFAGRRGDGVYQSTNNGDSWTPVNNGLGNLTVWALMFNTNADLFASTNSGVYRSTDNGGSWTLSGISGTTVVTLVRNTDGVLFAGSTIRGVYQSLTGGASCSQINSGLTDTSVYSLAISPNGALFAGTYDQGVFRFSQSATSVHQSSEGMPLSFSLSQNYPNPFNPSTKIDFSVPTGTFVSLKVYDLLGREVAMIVSEALTPGSYQVTFNGASVASGTYFYRLQAGEFVQTKKLVLQK